MQGRIELPSPSFRGTRTLEETLVKQRSDRVLLNRPIELAVVGQILWAGQGFRDRSDDHRAASVGSQSPLALYILTEEGVGRYQAEDHSLEGVLDEDLRETMYTAAQFQESLKQAPLVIAITASYDQAERLFGQVHAEHLTLIETGHIAQNMLLQAYAMGLAAVACGAFDEAKVHDSMQLPSDWEPLYLLAFGYTSG